MRNEHAPRSHPLGVTTYHEQSTTRLSPEGYDPTSTERVPLTGRLRRLVIWTFLVQLGPFLIYNAVSAVLLPLAVEDVNPASKAANLALVVVVGGVAGIIVPPVTGLLSDRSRTRLGRRAPFLLAGSGMSAAALVLFNGAGGLTALVLCYLLLAVGFNTFNGPFHAILPDRVPRGVRGVYSAATGLGVLFGVLGGQIVGALLAGRSSGGYWVLAGLFILVVVAFVRANPDHDNRADPPAKALRWSTVVSTFWINPLTNRDFAFAFLGRLLTFLGYYLVSSYQLYFVQDYIGLGEDAVDILPLFAVTALVTTLISTVVSGPLSDRTGRRKPIVAASGILIGLSVLGPWISPTVTGFLVYALIGGLGFGAFLAIDQALMSEVLPSSEDSGKDLGILNIAVTLPQTLAPAIAGLIVTSVGYAAVFPLALAVSALGAATVLGIRSVR